MVVDTVSVIVLEVSVVTLEDTVDVVVEVDGSVEIVVIVFVHPARNKPINNRNTSNPCRFIGPR